MMRLDAALAELEGPSTVAVAVDGDAVRIAASGTGLYAIGWTDVLAANTISSVQPMRCTP